MGLFNYVNLKMPCPYCGEMLEEFQTKDGDSCMSTVEPWTVYNFYTSCDNCERWVEYIRKDDTVVDLIKEGKEAVELLQQFADYKKLPEYRINQLLDSTREFLERNHYPGGGVDWMNWYQLRK
jgi:hypothetical protein